MDGEIARGEGERAGETKSTLVTSTLVASVRQRARSLKWKGLWVAGAGTGLRAVGEGRVTVSGPDVGAAGDGSAATGGARSRWG